MNDWRDKAACREYDAEIWFPVGETGPALLQIDEAKAICAHCPVRVECLEDEMRFEAGIRATSRHGIRGGLTGAERHSLYRQRNKQTYRDRQAVTAA